MTAQSILADLCEHGIAVRLADDRENLAVPAGRLSPEQRALVLANKAELVQFLLDAHETTVALIESAMRACDHFGDGDAARNDMRRQCLNTPIHVRADLLDHFNHTYPQNHKPEGN